MSRGTVRMLFGAAVCMWLVIPVASAQTQSTTTETTKAFEVIAVEGNDLVVKLPEGTKELTVPEGFKFMVNGQPMSVHDLKPGMKGTATITTTTHTTPVTVTEVKNGTVMKTTGSSIIVRTESGMKMFSQSDVDKRNIKIMRGGEPAQITDFREGDKLTASIITTKPPKVVTEKDVALAVPADKPAGTTGAPTTPAPAAAPPPSAPRGASAGASESAAPKKLPKTAGPLPLLAALGTTFLATGLALTLRRRRQR